MIYFLRLGNAVKIGYTRKLRRRMKTLATATPNDPVVLGVMPGHRGSEKELHQRFAHLHIKREWFRLEMDIVLLIESECRPYLEGIALVDEPRPTTDASAAIIGLALVIVGCVVSLCGLLEPSLLLCAAGANFLVLGMAIAAMDFLGVRGVSGPPAA